MPWKNTYWVKTRHAAQCILSHAVPTGHAKILFKELENGLHVFLFCYKPVLHIHHVAGVEYVPEGCLISTHYCLSSPSLCGATGKGIFGQVELARPVANQFLLVSWSGF